MGNCSCSQNVIGIDNLTKDFISSNVINKEYKMIIGTYLESNNSNKNNSNTMISQGICVGYNGNYTIYKLKLGMIHKYQNVMVLLYFENNTRLLLKKKNNNNIAFLFSTDDIRIHGDIDEEIIKNMKPINNNSEDIDLIFKLFN